MVWYSHLLKSFPQFVMVHTVKDFAIVNKAEVDVFLELSCFFHDPDVEVGFRKDRGTRDQITTSVGSSKKQESTIKASTSALLTMAKPLTVCITTNCGKLLNR